MYQQVKVRKSCVQYCIRDKYCVQLQGLNYTSENPKKTSLFEEFAHKKKISKKAKRIFTMSDTNKAAGRKAPPGGAAIVSPEAKRAKKYGGRGKAKDDANYEDTEEIIVEVEEVAVNSGRGRAKDDAAYGDLVEDASELEGRVVILDPYMAVAHVPALPAAVRPVPVRPVAARPMAQAPARAEVQVPAVVPPMVPAPVQADNVHNQEQQIIRNTLTFDASGDGYMQQYTALVQWTYAQGGMQAVLGMTHVTNVSDQFRAMVNVGLEIQLSSDDDDDEFAHAANNVVFQPTLSNTMTDLFMNMLHQVDVHQLHGISNMYKVNSMQLHEGPLNIIGTPQLRLDDSIVNFNKVGEQLRTPVGINMNYFYNHVEHRMTPGGGTTSFLPLAIGIPDFTLMNSTQIHDNGVSARLSNEVGNRGIVMKSTPTMRFVRAKFWDYYCHVLSGYYRMPLVMAAVSLKWYPLILFKNVLATKDRRDNKAYMTSVSRGARTGMYLIGFWKTGHEGLRVIALNSNDGVYVVERRRDDV